MPALSDLPAPTNAAPALAAEAETAPAAAPAPAEGQLPSPFAEVVQGSIPALLLPPLAKDAQPDPVQSFAVDNFDKLLSAGLDYFEAKDLSTVLFNPGKITEDQLKAADKAGKLAEIVQPAAAPAEQAPSTDNAPLMSPSAPAGPASVPPAVTKTRLSNLEPPGPAIKPNPVPDRLARRAI